MTNKIPKIRGFQNVYKDLSYLVANDPSVSNFEWLGRVKLHGTNAGIRIDADGTVTAQKKSADIFVGDDNFGFAAFVEELKKTFDFVTYAQLCFGAKGWSNVTIMGEWAGPGIQKGVAVSQLPEKRFFPFAIFVDHKDHGGAHEVHYASNQWHQFMSNFEEMDYVTPIDFAGMEEPKWGCNARDNKSVLEMVDKINEDVLAIEACDPFINEIFGIEGTGEGLVFYPYYADRKGWCTKSEFESLGFKVKGEKHAVSKAGKPARVKSALPESAYHFADMHCTEARMEQGLQETGGSLENENIGKFLGWVCRDINTECAQEIEESGLDWKKQLSGVITTKARYWFFEKQKSQVYEGELLAG